MWLPDYSFLFIFFVSTSYSYLFAWLEFWLNETRLWRVDQGRAFNTKLFGLGVPYHLPIMFGLFLTVSVLLFYPLSPRDLLRVASLQTYMLLLEDVLVQVIEWWNGYGWMRRGDWSAKWGWITVWGEYVVPVWYPVFAVVSVLLWLVPFWL